MTEAAPHSLVRTLQGVALLGGRSEEDLLEIVGRSANLRWEADETVFAAGDPAEALFVVVRGEILLRDDDGTEERRGPGDHLGEDVLSGAPEHTHDARATDESELMVIPREAIADLVDGSSDP